MNLVWFMPWYERSIVCPLPIDSRYASLPFLKNLFKRVLTLGRVDKYYHFRIIVSVFPDQAGVFVKYLYKSESYSIPHLSNGTF